MDEKDISKYYTILDLEIGATSEEVKEAYQALIKVWDPDRFLNDAHLHIRSQEKLIQINDAYRHLRIYFSEQNAVPQPDTDHVNEPPPKSTTNSSAVKKGKVRRKVKKVKEPKAPSTLTLFFTGVAALTVLVLGFLMLRCGK